MDFLLCCPRGPDHQGRHAVPEAESEADGPPWTAGAEKDRKRRNRPRGYIGGAVKPPALRATRKRKSGRDEKQTKIERRHQSMGCQSGSSVSATPAQGQSGVWH